MITRRSFLGTGTAAVLAVLLRPKKPKPTPTAITAGFGAGPFGAAPFGG